MALPVVDDGFCASQTEKSTSPEPFTQTDTVAQMNAIDTEIVWHYAQIALLKAKRNTIAPIFRLPNELLSRILTIHAVDSESLFNLRWTQIMYVCRRWRDLALAAHPLWSFIELGWTGGFRGFRRLVEQLNRSGVAPVTVKIASCHSANIIRVILPHSERICALELAGEAQYIHELIVSLPDHKLPILSSLHLDANQKLDEVPGGVLAALPQSILEGGIPNLRALTLASINLPWSSLRGLETLSLTKCNDTSQALQTFASVLEMLGASPHLKVLRLGWIIPLPLPDQQYTYLELPMLASIELDDTVTGCTALLNHLRFPPTTHIQIYPSHVNAGADIRELLVPLRKQIRAAGAPTIRLLAFNCHDVESLIIGAYHETSAPDPLNRDAPFLLYSHPHTENTLRQIMAKIVKALPFESITHLDARLAARPTPTSWRTALKLLPALEMVYLFTQKGAVSFLRALLEIELNERRRDTYPRLRCLHITAAVWDTKEHETIDLMLDLLAELLTHCRTHGRALSVLEIDERDHCLGRHHEKVEALPALVGERMVRNGRDYDPVKDHQELETLRAIWRAEEEAEEAAAVAAQGTAEVEAEAALDTGAGPSEAV
ncbi:hypothetical protein FB451DRAFT_1255080 [Mycena latifolia]|nr:hypothetical protein FB451DRAFT_1255080 [Mycena latifolia]